MNKKKKNFLILVLIILIVCLIVIILYNIIGADSSKKEKVSLELETKTLAICKDISNCYIAKDSEYEYIKLSNSTNEKLNKVVNKFNSKIDELYNASLNSNTNSEECSSVSDMYIHSLKYDVDTYLYESDSVISIYIETVEYNVCTNEEKKLEPMLYLYDVKNDKVLENDDLYNIYSVSDYEVQRIIKNAYTTVNNSESEVTIPDIVDYYLFVDFSGNLVASHDDLLGDGYSHTIIVENTSSTDK